MKTIALVSPSSSGHYETYLRLLTQTAAGLGHRVVAFTPDSNRLLLWARDTLPIADNQVQAIELAYRPRHRLPGIFSIWSEKLAWVREVSRTIQDKGVKPDLVFHAWLDHCLTPGLTAHLTDISMPYRWSGLYFHPWYLRQNLRYANLRRGPLTNHAALMSSRCPAVAVLDEGIADKLQQALKGKPVIVFPDFADDSPPDLTYPAVAEIHARAAGRKVIGLLGILTQRKGMKMLIDVARATQNEDWFFVFAGEYFPNTFTTEEKQQIEDFINSHPSNCLFHFQRIPTEAQFNALVCSCDVLFAVYRDFYSSSNLLTKAAIFKKPLIVSNVALMGERVKKYSLGLTIDETSTPQCVEGLRQLCELPKGAVGLPGAQYEAYAHIHSVNQLRGSFQTLLNVAGITTPV